MNIQYSKTEAEIPLLPRFYLYNTMFHLYNMMFGSKDLLTFL